MVTFRYVIKDELGIHARPAGMLVKEANGLKSSITMAKGQKSADVKKIFGLMGLGVKQKDEVTVTVEGSSEEADAAVIKDFLEKHL